MTINHTFVTELFTNLTNKRSDNFFEKVSDTVHWTVMGTHPLAGTYVSKEEFLAATFRRLDNVLQEGVILKINHVFVDGMTAIVEMLSLSTANNGKPFNNTYCWIVTFNERRLITKVRAYVDSALVQAVIDDNESA